MIEYELLILIAIFAYVYSNLLTEPNQILSGVYKKLYSFFKTDKRLMEGRGPHWLFKILIHCERCIAGQLALWFTLFGNWFSILIEPDAFMFFKVIFSITFAILMTIIIKALTNKIINQ